MSIFRYIDECKAAVELDIVCEMLKRQMKELHEQNFHGDLFTRLRSLLQKALERKIEMELNEFLKGM